MISPELLRRYPHFGFLNAEQLQAIAMISEQVEFDKGSAIVESEKTAEYLFVLVKGDAALYYTASTAHDPNYNREYHVTDINPGELFGISALIEPHEYTGRVVAEGNCKLIRIDGLALRALCVNDTKMSCGLYRLMAQAAMERLHHTRILLIAAQA